MTACRAWSRGRALLPPLVRVGRVRLVRKVAGAPEATLLVRIGRGLCDLRPVGDCTRRRQTGDEGTTRQPNRIRTHSAMLVAVLNPFRARICATDSTTGSG